jgi:hypothetical protein
MSDNPEFCTAASRAECRLARQDARKDDACRSDQCGKNAQRSELVSEEDLRGVQHPDREWRGDVAPVEILGAGEVVELVSKKLYPRALEAR